LPNETLQNNQQSRKPCFPDGKPLRHLHPLLPRRETTSSLAPHTSSLHKSRQARNLTAEYLGVGGGRSWQRRSGVVFVESHDHVDVIRTRRTFPTSPHRLTHDRRLPDPLISRSHSMHCAGMFVPADDDNSVEQTKRDWWYTNHFTMRDRPRLEPRYFSIPVHVVCEC
jgi:hypothetical protein